MLQSLSSSASARQAWASAYRAVRSSSRFPLPVSFEVPLIHEAFCCIVDRDRSSASLRNQRWLEHSIPQLVSSSGSPVDVARWLVPARAALYALWALRRCRGVR